jgi:transcriptional regulator with XRE-family HTH domain
MSIGWERFGLSSVGLLLFLSQKELEMDFGPWLKQIRAERKLDARSLANLTGVDASTITRIEGERTQATLLTAVRLCEGLDVSLSQLLQALRGSPLHEMNREGMSGGPSVPTAHDVETFLRCFLTNEEKGMEWLSNLLNQVVLLQCASEGKSRESKLPLFGPGDIQKLLFDTSVYRFELQYPPFLETEDILRIYQWGGVLTLADIGIYLRKARQGRNVTLTRLEESGKFSASGLSRLETGTVEQVKLAEMVTLDEQLEQEGQLLAMYWSVCKFNEQFARQFSQSPDRKDFPSPGRSDQALKLASLFITTCRWLQAFNPNDPSWMRGVRRS